MKNFLKLIRWKNILVIALTMMAMRMLVIFPVFKVYGIDVMFPDWGFYMLMLATMLIAAGGYVINDYFDVHIDSVNRSDKRIIGVSVPRRKAIALHLWLSIFGLACGVAATVAAHRFWYIFVFIGAFALLWIYSRDLKKSTFWGNLLIAMLSAIVPLLVGMTEYFAVADSISYWDISHIRAVKMAMQVIIFFSFFVHLDARNSEGLRRYRRRQTERSSFDSCENRSDEDKYNCSGNSFDFCIRSRVFLVLLPVAYAFFHVRIGACFLFGSVCFVAYNRLRSDIAVWYREA